MRLKVLATTGLALTLGLTSIGTNVTPTYAAVSEANIAPSIESKKDVYSSNNLFKFASFNTTGFQITSQEKTLKSIDYAVNDNSVNSSGPSTIKSASKEYSQTDSLTVNASTEFSVGTELSASAKIPGIADVTAKMTTGFKASAGISKLTSETKKLAYGGDEIVAKPNQTVRVDYFLEEITTSGNMNTGTRITEIGDNLKVDKLDEDDTSPGSIVIEEYVPGHLSGEDVYNTFKRIEEMNKQAPIYLGRTDGLGVDVPTIPKGKFSDYFFMDDVAKTVSTVGSKASFNGVAGTGLTAKTSTIDPVTNAQTTISEEQIQQP
ncbi:ETX/MTX2 family pore-forming toxin [Bacillus mycoides]|uniref:ETX/MTX2 family pore-forming toxin n=1 Tax=Bacillus mycoides TaxID=1405 RepID=UPI002E1F26DD|nr:ETX/MTX2 family pore-forming toxin [Bacillus mycoides]